MESLCEVETVSLRQGKDGQADVAALLRGRSTPLVMRGALQAVAWPAKAWGGPGGLAVLARQHGRRKARVRLAPRRAARTCWEGECETVDASLGELCCWLGAEGLEAGAEGSLSAYSRSKFWGYCSYQHFEELFPDLPDANREAADFGELWGTGGAPGTASSAPTLWLGSAGACTPCHQDAYGCNTVAQLGGEKRWLLFPPGAAGGLGPRRLPYEDASTFTAVDPLRPAGPRQLAACGGQEARLRAGDALFVPRHWFHAVECVSPWSLSLNQWLDLPEDSASRVHEAIVRCLATPLLQEEPPGTDAESEEGEEGDEENEEEAAEEPGEEWWVNPGEELFPRRRNLAFLAEALQATGGVRGALLRAVTHPEVVELVARRLEEELGQQDRGLHPGRATPARGGRSRSRSPGREET